MPKMRSGRRADEKWQEPIGQPNVPMPPLQKDVYARTQTARLQPGDKRAGNKAVLFGSERTRRRQTDGHEPLQCVSMDSKKTQRMWITPTKL